MSSTQFIQINVGQSFHCGRDKDGSMLVWKKINAKQAKCVNAIGRYKSRWVGIVDNFFSFDKVWGV